MVVSGEGSGPNLCLSELPSPRILRPSALPSRMVRGTLDGMTIKIDKAGRIVLPKPVRERFHLREGSELELEERSDGLTLRPVEQRSSMVQEKGIWVHLGKVPRGFDWGSVVEAIRDERIKDASGI
jgi:AbrB family looped-hinge helix DNA binding protein